MRIQVFRHVTWSHGVNSSKGNMIFQNTGKHPTTQHHILEDVCPHQHHCKNAASYKTVYLQKAVHGLPLYPQVVQIKLLNAKGLFHHMQDSVQCLMRQLYVTGSELSEPSVVLQSTDYWHDVPEHNTTRIYIIHPHLLRISQNIYSVCLT